MPDRLSVEDPSEPYAFISYSHGDEAIVHEELEILRAAGFRVWHDANISAGTRWRDELAMAIDAASFLAFFVSRSSASSTNCIQEIHYAVDQGIPILPIYLEETALPPNLRLVLAQRQVIYACRQTADDYRASMVSAFERLNRVHGPARSTRAESRSPLTKDRLHIAITGNTQDRLAASISALLTRYLSWQGGVFRPHNVDPDQSGPGNHIDYEIGIQVNQEVETAEILCRVREATTGEVLWTYRTELPAEMIHTGAHHLSELLGEGAIRKISGFELSQCAEVPADELDYAQLILRSDQLQYLDAEETRSKFEHLDRAIQLEPSCGIAFACRATLLSWQILNRNSDAEEDLRKLTLDAARQALKRDPDDPFILLSTGTTFCRLGIYERGLTLIRRAYRMAPSVRAKNDLARSLCFAGQPEEAVALFEEILETMPEGLIFPYARLAVALSQAGRIEAAAQYSRSAILNFPEDYYGWLVHCNALKQLGEEAGASEALIEAERLVPKLDLAKVIERTESTYGRNADQAHWLTAGLRMMLKQRSSQDDHPVS